MVDDDVRWYQTQAKAACEQAAAGDAAAVAACDTTWRMDKTSEVCKLVLYQSLAHSTMTTGDGTLYDGVTGFYDSKFPYGMVHFRTQADKMAGDSVDQFRHDADGFINGHSAQDPDGNLVHYSSIPPVNPINAVPKCARQPAHARLPALWS